MALRSKRAAPGRPVRNASRARSVVPTAVAVGILTLLLTFPDSSAVPSSWVPAPTKAISASAKFWSEFDTKIQHIVIITMENHAYDSYFGAYCLVTGTYCPTTGNGIPAGTCVPLNPDNLSSVRATGCVRPYNFTASNYSIRTTMPHDYNSTIAAWNNGSMNNFYAAEVSGLDPFGHYNRTTAGLYWDLAEEYGISDDYYSSVPSYTLPNRWHLVAGANPPAVFWEKEAKGRIGGIDKVNRTAYLAEANQTPTIEGELTNATNVSWRWYQNPIGTNYTAARENLNGGTPKPSTYGYFDPLAARAMSYTPNVSKHFVSNGDYWSDVALGTLPNISVLVSLGQFDDHPPASSALSQGWVLSAIDAAEAGPEWNSTAIFVTYDEYGGFYDGVAPPSVNGSMLGFRIPLFVISPYSTEGFIDHQLCYIDCLLHLVEQRFHLACLATMDCYAPINDLEGFFNFSQIPRQPLSLPTEEKWADYPLKLQPLNVRWKGGPDRFTPPSSYRTSVQTLPDID